jgi:glycosyltransferase involved in cell wall biosynthesis
LLDLISLSDCYLSLHRAEGFGLTLLEAMAMGKPVLATDYSGSKDFLNETTGFPVNYRLSPIRRQAGPYPPGYDWADPDIDEASELLTRVRRDSAEVSKRVIHAQNVFRTEWSTSAGAERFRSHLHRLWLNMREQSSVGQINSRARLLG